MVTLLKTLYNHDRFRNEIKNDVQMKQKAQDELR